MGSNKASRAESSPASGDDMARPMLSHATEEQSCSLLQSLANAYTTSRQPLDSSIEPWPSMFCKREPCFETGTQLPTGVLILTPPSPQRIYRSLRLNCKQWHNVHHTLSLRSRKSWRRETSIFTLQENHFGTMTISCFNTLRVHLAA